MRNGFIPLRHAFANRKPSNRITRKIHCNQGLGAFRSQFGNDAALHDTEKRLRPSAGSPSIMGVVIYNTAFRPSVRPLHRLPRVFRRAGVGGALVERHDNIRAEIALDLHHAFGRENVPRTVNVRLELNAVLADAPQPGQAEHLKAAAVRQQRPRPALKSVQAARVRDQIFAGAQVQVIGVPQNKRKADFAQFSRRHGFHRRLRTDGHEYGCFKRGMGKLQGSAPPPNVRFRTRMSDMELKLRPIGRGKWRLNVENCG